MCSRNCFECPFGYQLTVGRVCVSTILPEENTLPEPPREEIVENPENIEKAF